MKSSLKLMESTLGLCEHSCAQRLKAKPIYYDNGNAL